MIAPLRDQLRSLANDCRERCRIADSEMARLLLNDAARQCEILARDRFASISALQRKLVTMQVQAHVARCHEGEEIEFPLQAPASLSGREGGDHLHHRPQPSPAAPSAPARPPDSAVNASKLSERFGVPERTARRTIERLVCQGRPGFYGIANGERTRWLADPEAFARVWP
jgi:hypothetical protein